MNDKAKSYIIVSMLYFAILSTWLFWNMKGNPFLADSKTRFAETKAAIIENMQSMPAAIGLIFLKK